MAATGSFNAGTNVLSLDGDGLPRPVLAGTFPNANNPNTISEQNFEHSFLTRGGSFGVSKTFDANTFTQTGFVITIPISVDDNALLGNDIQVGDNLLFVFSDGRKQKFVYTGTEFTSTNGFFWRATDQQLQLVTNTNQTTSGTYQYYDQNNGRTAIPLGIIGITTNGVAIYNPSAGAAGNPPLGFNWNAHFQGSPNFGDDNCGGRPETSGQYHYRDKDFLDCWKSNAVMSRYNDYYGLSQFNGDNIRHSDGHSKIVGYSFDGWPIYGPFGYSDPWDQDSDVVSQESSYETFGEPVEGRPSYGTSLDNPPAGALIQDWRYVEGAGTLDRHNGRFCVTPEYPDGTYAYFVTVNPLNIDEPAYPYIIGEVSRETLDIPENGGVAPPESITTPPPPPVPPLLEFTLQPQGVTSSNGQSATFNVTARITPEDGGITYQWYKSTDGGFAFSLINGATSNSYTFNVFGYMTGYVYRCEIAGPTGAAPASNSPLLSNPATLTVTGGVGGGVGSGELVRFDVNTLSFDGTLTRIDVDNDQVGFAENTVTLDDEVNTFDLT